MSLEAAIFDRLSNYAGLTALISTRIYPDGTAPQDGTTPYMTYQRISTEPVMSLSGDSGMETARFQFDMYGPNKLALISVAEQLRAALKRYRGTHASVEFVDAWLDNEQDFYEAETRLSRISQDYEIVHR